MSTEADTGVKKRKDSTPPDGYVCRLCSVPGHWIQVCPTKKTGSKKRKSSDHVPVAGQDPSPDDIERAKELQAIPPPKCFCGLPSRLNKVKRSKVQEESRAIGKYFFFCSKKRDDETQCRFARPVDMELKKDKKIDSRMKAKKKEGVVSKAAAREDKTSTNKTNQVCKFFAKTGSCKKGDKCEFSHEKGGGNVKKATAPAKTQKKETSTPDEETKDESDKSSSDSSSSDSSSSDSSSDSDDGVVEMSTTNAKDDDSSSDDSDSASSDESE